MTPLAGSQTPAAIPARVGHDAVVRFVVRAAALCIVLMLAVLMLVLAKAALPSVRAFGAGFITATDWRPNEIERPQKDEAGHVVMVDGEVQMESLAPAFGALPAIAGTIFSAALALLFALPLAVLTALFLVRIGPHMKAARAVSSFVEVLAAIPSIAFGMWGLFVIAPLVGRNLLCGGLILAVMILPIVTAVARDVLAGVPVPLVEGTVALGATWWQTSWAMVRESRRGLFGAAVLGLARAAGETMAVTMVIGNAPRVPTSLFEPAQTMASLLANEVAEASSDLHRGALLEVALLLLLMSLALNVIARRLVT